MEDIMHIIEELCKHLLHHWYEVDLIEYVDHVKKLKVEGILSSQLEIQQFKMLPR